VSSAPFWAGISVVFALLVDICIHLFSQRFRVRVSTVFCWLSRKDFGVVRGQEILGP
jgi:hypothetical protein